VLLGANGFLRKPATTAAILAALHTAQEEVARDAPRKVALDEASVLECYNSALARKLEDRNRELQQSLTQIHQAHEEIIRLNQTLETRVAQRTSALEAAVAELEMTAHIVGSELGAHFRTIAANAEQLEQPPATTDQDERRAWLQDIRAAADRMSQLVDILSGVSQLSSSPVSCIQLDLEPLVDEAIANVRSATAGRSIQWHRQSLPAAVADPNLLRQVLVELIHNALRYTTGRDPAVIEIGYRAGRAGELVIYIRDNGMGYDIQVDDSPEGHRGLAHIRRILARHGGRLWSESAVGTGTTVSFTLPQPDGAD
jgi:light-regulated signal transduction histidine kinase (bacteriophytochrome)